ncbi:Unknown protein, partial [Striga hermonthica]
NKFFTDTVCKKLGFAERNFTVEPVGLSGGLLLLWCKEVVVVQVININFILQVEYKMATSETSEWLILVYASTDYQRRKMQWLELEGSKHLWGSKWCIGGDWNALCGDTEKRGGRVGSQSNFEEFNNFIARMGMLEVRMEGYPYTWCNNRQGEDFIEEKLDRTYFKCASDLSMLLLDTGTTQSLFFKRFYFDKRWLSKPGCQEEVEEAWVGSVEGSLMYVLKEKIKKTRMALTKRNKEAKSLNVRKIADLTLKLEEMRALGGQRNWEEWEKVKKELEESHVSEEEFWKQKARVTWLKGGDKNTHFFHVVTMQRRKRNAISRVVDNMNRVAASQEHIEACFINFYQTLFTSEGSCDDDDILQLISPVNLAKSSVFFSRNASVGLKAEICQCLIGIEVCHSSRYLGLPLRIGKSKKE